MKTLNHPNIIKFEEFYVGDKTYHIITEYVRGGTLDNYIQKCPDIDNASIKLIMKVFCLNIYTLVIIKCPCLFRYEEYHS